MKKKYINAFIHRVIEMFLGSFVISLIICLLCISDFARKASIQRDIILLLGPIIYLVWNTFKQRSCFYYLKSRSTNLLVNLCAQAVFLAANIFVYTMLPDETYSWLFIITGFMRFSRLGIAGHISIALFHIVAATTIFISVTGMGWIKERDIEAREYIDNMPPPLKLPEEKSE